MQKLEITLDKVRLEIDSRNEPEQKDRELAPKLTPQAKRVLELSADEARRLHCGEIDTQHLLLGLGLDLEKCRALVLDQLGPEIPALPSIIEKMKRRFSRE